MSRRKAAPKRVILPDPLFGSELIAKFINTVMRHGKKAIAEKIVYGALEFLVKKQGGKGDSGDSSSEAGGKNEGSGSLDVGIWGNEEARAFAFERFKQALGNITPTVEVKSRRVGGSTYQVPVEIRADRRRALAMRWLVQAANQRSEKTMALRLCFEILEATEGHGGAVKKREEVHRMAKANQAFAHYRW